MKTVALIPARMGSSRFPGKPMSPICGMPMVEHVYWRCRLASAVDETFVATCDEVIRDHIEKIGGKAIMTSDKHERASDRVAEALISAERLCGHEFDIALLVQGDEPMMAPEMLDALAAPLLEDSGIGVSNLAQTVDSDEEFVDPNCVKVVMRPDGTALYLSREPIPSASKYDGAYERWKQVGIIGFRRKALLEYTELTPTPLEIIESIDVNRILEHGRTMMMVPTAHSTHAVDTRQDLDYVEKLMAADQLCGQYPLTVTSNAPEVSASDDSR